MLDLYQGFILMESMELKILNLFPLQKFSMNTLLMEYFLEYHLRGICTEKGTANNEPNNYNK